MDFAYFLAQMNVRPNVYLTLPVTCIVYLILPVFL